MDKYKSKKSLTQSQNTFPCLTVVIPRLSPTRMHPVALRQFSNLTEKDNFVTVNQSTKDLDMFSMVKMLPRNRAVETTTPIMPSPIQQERQTLNSADLVIDCDDYFCNMIYPSPASPAIKQHYEPCTPDSPISLAESIEDQLCLESCCPSAENVKNLTHKCEKKDLLPSETRLCRSICAKDQLTKDLTVSLQPIDCALKTIFLKDSQNPHEDTDSLVYFNGVDVEERCFNNTNTSNSINNNVDSLNISDVQTHSNRGETNEITIDLDATESTVNDDCLDMIGSKRNGADTSNLDPSILKTATNVLSDMQREKPLTTQENLKPINKKWLKCIKLQKSPLIKTQPQFSKVATTYSVNAVSSGQSKTLDIEENTIEGKTHSGKWLSSIQIEKCVPTKTCAKPYIMKTSSTEMQSSVSLDGNQKNNLPWKCTKNLSQNQFNTNINSRLNTESSSHCKRKLRSSFQTKDDSKNAKIHSLLNKKCKLMPPSKKTSTNKMNIRGSKETNTSKESNVPGKQNDKRSIDLTNKTQITPEENSSNSCISLMEPSIVCNLLPLVNQVNQSTNLIPVEEVEAIGERMDKDDDDDDVMEEGISSKDVHNWLMCDRNLDSIPNEEELEAEINANKLNHLTNNFIPILHDHSYSLNPEHIQHSISKRGCSNASIDASKRKCNLATRSSKIALRNKKTTKDKTKSNMCKPKRVTSKKLIRVYNLTAPLKELVVRCEHLNPDKLNILTFSNDVLLDPLNKKSKQKAKKHIKNLKVTGKVKKHKKKKKIPMHYTTYKPNQIRTIKRMDMRYRVAFSLWPSRYSGALDKINQRLTNQNAFWKSI